MSKKLFALAIIWAAGIFAYIMLGFLMPVWLTLSSNATAAMDATANMSNFPGTKEMVQSSPVWVWFIPGSVIVVATVVMLKGKTRE